MTHNGAADQPALCRQDTDITCTDSLYIVAQHHITTSRWDFFRLRSPLQLGSVLRFMGMCVRVGLVINCLPLTSTQWATRWASFSPRTKLTARTYIFWSYWLFKDEEPDWIFHCEPPVAISLSFDVKINLQSILFLPSKPLNRRTDLTKAWFFSPFLFVCCILRTWRGESVCFFPKKKNCVVCWRWIMFCITPFNGTDMDCTTEAKTLQADIYACLPGRITEKNRLKWWKDAAFWMQRNAGVLLSAALRTINALASIIRQQHS